MRSGSSPWREAPERCARVALRRSRARGRAVARGVAASAGGAALRARDDRRRGRRRQVAPRRGGARRDRRAIVRGRCLPYGEGITYWPVVEVLKQLDALPSDPVAAAAIRSLLGETDEEPPPRRSPGRSASCSRSRRPLVVVFDDIQWGEETFLDLVEGVALLSSGAPILLVCMARPELLSRRSEWPVVLRLEPLPSEAVDELIGDLPAELRERITAAAGGNPLFLTEMLAMAAERRTRSRSRPRFARCSPLASTSSTPAERRCSSAARSRARSSTAAPSRRLPRRTSR